MSKVKRRKKKSMIGRRKNKSDARRKVLPGCAKRKRRILLRQLRVMSRSVNKTQPDNDGGGGSYELRNRWSHSWLKQLSYPFQPQRHLGQVKCCSDGGSQYKVSFIPTVVSIIYSFNSSYRITLI